MPMKRILFLILIAVMILPSAGWPASITKTVCSSGCDYTTIRGAVDYIRTNGDGSSTNYINIGAGTYSSANDYVYLDNSKLSNLVITGAGKDSTIITPSGSKCLYSTASAVGLTVSNLTIMPELARIGVDKNADSGTWVFTNVKFLSKDNHTTHLVYLNGDPTNLTSCDIVYRWTTGTVYPFYMGGDSSGTIKHCLSYAHGAVAGGTSKVLSNAWVLSGSGTVNISNCVVVDSSSHGIQPTAGTVNISNSIITGGVANISAYPIYRTGGTVTTTNNHYIANPWTPTYFTYGTISDTGSSTDSRNPYFSSYGRGGYIIIRIDDGAGISSGYVAMVEAKLASRGWKGTYYTQYGKGFSADTFDITSVASDLRALVSRGTMELGSHSYTHSDLSLADGDALITLSGGGTLTIARTGGTGGNGLITYSRGGTIDQFRTKTLYAIRAELTGLLSGSDTLTNNAYSDSSLTGGKISSQTLGEVIKEASAGATTLSLYVDTTGVSGLFNSEMSRATNALTSLINAAGDVTDPQTGATYVTNTFGYPFDKSSASSTTAMKTLYSDTGYHGASGSQYTTASSGEYFLPLLDLYETFPMGVSLIKGDGTEATIRKNARALFFSVAQSGGFLTLLTHTTSDLTSTQWDWLLDELSKFPQITVTSLQLANKAIRNGWTSNGSGVWSKGFGASDFHLQVNSPDINAGVIVTGIHDQETAATDYAGTSITTLPDIGAYEYPDQNLYFDANASAGGNGTKEYPYHLFADYPSWSDYAVRAGSNIYASGTFETGVDLSSLTSLPTTTGCKKNKTCSFPLTGTAVPVHGFRGQSMMCAP